MTEGLPADSLKALEEEVDRIREKEAEREERRRRHEHSTREILSRGQTEIVQKEFVCRGCGGTFPFETSPIFANLVPAYCDRCEPPKTRNHREEEWRLRIPKAFRKTDPEHPGLNPALLEWALRDAVKARGSIGIVGDVEIGKTRIASLLLRKRFEAGKSVEMITHTAFTTLIQDAFSGDGIAKSRGRERLDRLKRVGALLLDDIGKARTNEESRADAELYELIDHRYREGLPILWTAQGGGEWMEKRFGVDRGPAMIRRLCDGAAIWSQWKEQKTLDLDV